MKFDAVVGNPPYQLEGGSGGTNDSPIFQHFCNAAEAVESGFVSMIIPSKWFTAGRENLLGEFRRGMLRNPHLAKLVAFVNSRELFPSVEIKGGVCYYLISRDRVGLCEYELHEGGSVSSCKRDLSVFDIFIRNTKLSAIVEKVVAKAKTEGCGFVDSMISSDTPFGIPTNPKDSKKTPFDVRDTKTEKYNVALHYLEKNHRVKGYVKSRDIKKNSEDVKFDKVFIPKAGGSGADPNVLGAPIVASKNSVCSQTYLYAKFPAKVQAENFVTYLQTRFLRVLVSAVKVTQDALSRVYQFVPIQDFSEPWDDAKLYRKYGITKEEQKFIESMIKPMA